MEEYAKRIGHRKVCAKLRANKYQIRFLTWMVISSIVLLQKSGFYIMDKNFTLSHRSTVLR
jgi:hypothetical protein